jgi:hypothetical protein
LYAGLYTDTGDANKRSAGSIIGNLSTVTTISGNLTWNKEALAIPGYLYTSGFSNYMAVESAGYTAPAPGSRVIELNLGIGYSLISGGSLSSTLSNSVVLSTANKFTLNSAYTTKLAVKTKDGTVSGTFKNPNEADAVNKLAGIVNQPANSGKGYARGVFKPTTGTESGKLEVEATP